MGNVTKRRLLFLMPSLAGGGAERTLINLFKAIDYTRYEVHLVVVAKYGPYVKQVPQEVQTTYLFNSNLVVRILALLQKKTGWEWLFKQRIQRKLGKQTFDVGISFLDSNFTNLLFFVEGIKRRFTWVHSSYKSYRNFARFYENKAYREKLIKERYSRLDGICFVSHDALEEFKEVFGEYDDMRVVYNLIDSNGVLEKACVEKADKVDTRFQFVALGSLLPVKGFDRLIRAAKILKDQGEEFLVTIAGRGPEEDQLKKLVDENQLNNYISFAGFLSNPYSLLKSADAFVMSSVSEALPTVLCEAMILGKPTVVTNCSGCRELVEQGKYGLMAEQDDADLASKMSQYITNPELLEHFHKQSLERANIFNDQAMLAEYYDVFER
ncbi:glycosyltransferase [Puteibacter caeruleilacunae]|nr:glycosyltransferase [Puteibacter caeruleilacunae]